MLVLIDLYPVTPISLTLIAFKGHSSFNWNFLFSSDEVETLYYCYLCQVDHEYTTISSISAHVEGSWLTFTGFEKKKMLPFSQTPLKQDLFNFA